MDKIEVRVLNTDVIPESEKMMVAMARLTQRGHKIQSMEDFLALVNQPYKGETLETMLQLPHPTIQKFGAINIAIVGASRRFLAQITRHQNEVKFMSGSLQYSDYSTEAQFCVPYEIMEAENKWRSEVEDPTYLQVQCESPLRYYYDACETAMRGYRHLVDIAGNDAAGYAAPQGLRNVLLISATPYQWLHMIRQRSCNRNTLETQFVMLRCWEELARYSAMFNNCGPACVSTPGMYGICPEGKMSCNQFPGTVDPTGFLNERFPLIRRDK